METTSRGLLFGAAVFLVLLLVNNVHGQCSCYDNTWMCDESCFNEECNWDNGECHLSTCDYWCLSSWVNNSVCDFWCMYSADCQYDGDDCNTCLCDSSLIGNGICDSQCLTPECDYDGNDCCSTECKAGIGDGWCDSYCYVPECTYDLPDCECGKDWSCDDTWIGDGYCDYDCDTFACNYDFDACLECAPGCTDDMLWNYHCDEECNVPECDNDDGNCYSGTNLWIGLGCTIGGFALLSVAVFFVAMKLYKHNTAATEMAVYHTNT
ncbi:hypothetical protein Pelo_9051 [Pelomyxa schiedti]|nr:hypothetical protein Pelo_9051 [Pelomyxa schiedti]